MAENTEVAEQTEVAPEVRAVAEAQGSAEEKTPEQQAAWDKLRQHKDQEAAANARAAAAQAALQESQLAAAQEKGRLQAELDALKAQVPQTPGPNATDEDEADYDTLVRTVREKKQELADFKAQSQAALEAQRAANEANSREIASIREAQALRDGNIEGKRRLDTLCKPLGERYGAHLTNAVVDAVNAKFLENGIGALADKPRAAWIAQELELSYIKAAAAENKTATTKSKPSPTVDAGGKTTPPADELPEGKLEDVAKAMRERNKRRAGIT